ncbi:PAS domain S-box protein [Thiocapsa rosea]|uniref:PAS domain S-box protein n=1 Tax=Thiocapsa rosea TaxID=69360 RepID=UPI001B86AB6B|nr:PAS domain S-box protein [Thiocapsa rosea]
MLATISLPVMIIHPLFTVVLGLLLVERLRRRRDLDALRASEERFHGTFEQAAVGIAMVAPDGRWIKVNARLCHILGYDVGSLLGSSRES